MLKKAIGLLLFAAVTGLAASAQTTRQQLEKSLQDPKRKENEARADRRLHQQNRVISDATNAASQKNKALERNKAQQKSR